MMIRFVFLLCLMLLPGTASGQMRVASGDTTQQIYFVALDTGGSRVTGLSSFTVYRSRDGAAAAAMTTPTVIELDATNMPGVYALLLDEDMTIDAGSPATEEMAFHIAASGMQPVTRTVELSRYATIDASNQIASNMTAINVIGGGSIAGGLAITNSGGDAIDINGSASAIDIDGGTGEGLSVASNSNDAVELSTTTGTYGLRINAPNSGLGIEAATVMRFTWKALIRIWCSVEPARHRWLAWCWIRR